MSKQLPYTIVDQAMLIKAMRDSGYRSTTHALAELVDNSIESEATSIEIFGISRHDSGTNRVSMKELAVLDNGHGMDAQTLRNSLRYGQGTRQGRKGIGRFGLGLPNSSISQARRVEVWSWQNGVTNALHTWLSLDEVEEGMDEIHDPKLEKIPDVYMNYSQNSFGESGTLVVWKELDRVEWKQASTTFKHTDHLLGRIYRRFICDPAERLYTDDDRNSEIGKKRTIRCIPLNEIDGKIEFQESDVVQVKPNDPLYLMSGTSCPGDYGEGPMFMELEGSPFHFEINNQIVRVRATYARPLARDPESEGASWPDKYTSLDAGSTPWGKHASANMGVSIVRAHREIQLDDSWISGDDPRERWWTIEIDFPPELDDLFGVVNNKQGAVTFERLAKFDWRREARSNENNFGDVRRRMQDEGDERFLLIDLHEQIKRILKLIRPEIRKARKRRHPKGGSTDTEARATITIEQRREEGHRGKTDDDAEKLSKQEQEQKQIESLTITHHLGEMEARGLISETQKKNYRARILESHQSTPAFFDINLLPGVLQVVLNAEHPVYKYLYDVLRIRSDDTADMDQDEILERLENAAFAFEILLFSFARYEDEQSESERRKVRNMRIEWGKYAEEFFDSDDGSISPTDVV